MNSVIRLGIASILAACFTTSTAAYASEPSVLANELIEGCLASPTKDGVSHLAIQVSATPYSGARRQQELKTETFRVPDPDDNRDQQTRTMVTEFLGWDLPQTSTGTILYKEEKTEISWVDRLTGQPVTPVQVARNRACQLSAPVARARAMFELYEKLTDLDYGIRISADRRWVDFFTFDPDHYDIELSFALDTPLAGLPPGRSEGRLILADGGPRVSNYVGGGIEPVTLTRARFLAGLDQTATMRLINETIEPVVQRLATAGR